MALLPHDDKVVDVFDKLKESTLAYIKAEIALSNAEYTMREWYVIALCNGAIEGRNDAEREGNARMARPDLYVAVQMAKEEERRAWGVREVDRLEARKISNILRLAELLQVVGDPEESHEAFFDREDA